MIYIFIGEVDYCSRTEHDMEGDVKKKKILWQKKAIKDLLFLYLIVVLVFAFQSLEFKSELDESFVFSRRAAVGEKEKNEVKKVALTFDDGPHPVYTEQILDGLKERGVKATFFITGGRARQYPEIVKRIHDEGHLIGNHTYSHIQLTKNNLDEFMEELVLTSQVIAEITGTETLFVRPPYGLWDIRLESKLNMFPVMWTIDPRDWNRTNVSGIVADVVNNVGENDIILLHDDYESTKKASLIIVDRLLEEGYQFVTVDEILLN